MASAFRQLSKGQTNQSTTEGKRETGHVKKTAARGYNGRSLLFMKSRLSRPLHHFLTTGPKVGGTRRHYRERWCVGAAAGPALCYVRTLRFLILFRIGLMELKF